jgi:hypothetical protein
VDTRESSKKAASNFANDWPFQTARAIPNAAVTDIFMKVLKRAHLEKQLARHMTSKDTGKIGDKTEYLRT